MKRKKYNLRKKWNVICRAWKAKGPATERYFESQLWPNTCYFVGLVATGLFFTIGLALKNVALKDVSGLAWTCLSLSLGLVLVCMVILAYHPSQKADAYY